MNSIVDPESGARECRPLRTLRDNCAESAAGLGTPRMEDVSEQVMAQPYIRFT